MAKKSKYRGLGIALGAGIGTAIGVSTDQLAVWIPACIVFGMLLGNFYSKREANR